MCGSHFFCFHEEAPAVKMEFNPFVISDQSENHKRHFKSPFHIHRKIMSSPRPKLLRQKYNLRSVPIRKDDEVQVLRGHYKGQQLAKKSRLTGRNMSPTQKECSGRKLMVPLLLWVFSSPRWLSLD